MRSIIFVKVYFLLLGVILIFQARYKKPSPRIFNGTEVKNKDLYPFFVSIKLSFEDHVKYAPHSEPEVQLDGFEMNMGNDYYPSLVSHMGY